MTECSELTDQIVNSLIVTLFLLGGWMLSVYGQAGPEMFDSNDDITWELTMNDNDSNNDPSDPDYRKFLSRLSNALLPHLKIRSQGLDFGAGPGPALALSLIHI